MGWSAARSVYYNIALLTELCKDLQQRFLMQKINEAAIGKNQQIVGLKVLISWLHYITMHFADIKFSNKMSMKTQVFVFSRFKNSQNT